MRNYTASNLRHREAMQFSTLRRFLAPAAIGPDGRDVVIHPDRFQVACPGLEDFATPPKVRMFADLPRTARDQE